MSVSKASARAIRRGVQRRVPRFAMVFAILFAVLAGAQYWLLRQAVYGSVEQQLKEWADSAVELIAYKDHWNLREYRQSADILAANSFVVTSQGTIIEARGFIPGLLKKVSLPTTETKLFEEPMAFTSDTNDQWTLYGRKLTDSAVVLGILNYEKVVEPDKLLKEAASQFEKTRADALKVRSGQTA